MVPKYCEPFGCGLMPFHHGAATVVFKVPNVCLEVVAVCLIASVRCTETAEAKKDELPTKVVIEKSWTVSLQTFLT